MDGIARFANWLFLRLAIGAIKLVLLLACALPICFGVALLITGVRPIDLWVDQQILEETSLSLVALKVALISMAVGAVVMFLYRKLCKRLRLR